MPDEIKHARWSGTTVWCGAAGIEKGSTVGTWPDVTCRFCLSRSKMGSNAAVEPRVLHPDRYGSTRNTGIGGSMRYWAKRFENGLSGVLFRIAILDRQSKPVADECVMWVERLKHANIILLAMNGNMPGPEITDQPIEEEGI